MQRKKEIIPIFPLEGIVIFPEMNLPLYVFDEKYVTLIYDCLNNNVKLGVVLLREDACAEVGTLVEVISIEQMEKNKINVLTEAKSRFKILEIVSKEPHYMAEIESYEDEDLEKALDKELKASLKYIKTMTTHVFKTLDKASDEKKSKKIKLPKEPDKLLFLLAGNLTCDEENKQMLLETKSIRERIQKITPLLNEEIEKAEAMLENKRTKKVVVKNGYLN